MRSEPQDMAAFKWEHLWYYVQVGMCRMKIKREYNGEYKERV